MQHKQTIAIIGATGNMGSAIARSLAKESNRLLLFSKSLEKSQALAEELNKDTSVVEPIDCSYNASWEADIIILAVPYEAEKALAEKIKQVANQKIVISISNPVNSEFNGLVTDPATSAAEELQKLLPNSKVIKTFNTTFAADFANPVIDGKQVDAFIAGNDKEALETVTELVKTAGFNPVIAGDLPVSGTLERMQLLLMQLTMKNNYNWLAGWKILHN
jgi:NADPH-dependent F420 reductase